MNKVKVIIEDEKGNNHGKAILPFVYDKKGNISGVEDKNNYLIFGSDVFVKSGSKWIKHQATIINEYEYPPVTD